MKSRPFPATVQIWRLADDGTPAWHDIGVATTERGLTRALGTALDHTYRVRIRIRCSADRIQRRLTRL